MSADGSDEGEDVAEDDAATVADIIEEAEPSASADRERSGAAEGEWPGASDDEQRADGDRADEDDDEGAVAGSFAPDIEVRPQLPAPENTAFVALGVCLTILALADTVVGLSLVLVATVVATVGLGTAVCYGVLVWTTPDT